MVAVLVIGGVQMLMMGVLGEYLWRTLDESRRRPRFLIEETTETENVAGSPSEGASA
jgi:dolichol-phosphate mannosyltransferase